jgi:hypothetical protein
MKKESLENASLDDYLDEEYLTPAPIKTSAVKDKIVPKKRKDMKVIYEFDLDKEYEDSDLKMFQNARKMCYALNKIDSEVRSKLKHQENLDDATRSFLEHIRFLAIGSGIDDI